MTPIKEGFFAMASTDPAHQMLLKKLMMGALVLLDIALLSLSTLLHAAGGVFRARPSGDYSQILPRPNNQDRLRQAIEIAWNRGTTTQRSGKATTRTVSL
jgi:hypothetical protein